MPHGFEDNKAKYDLSEIFNEVKNIELDLLKKVYPLGSIYWSINSTTNPAALLGFGRWQIIGGGNYVRLGDGSHSGTGGSNTVQLEAKNLPNHTHYISTSGGNNTKKERIQIDDLLYEFYCRRGFGDNTTNLEESTNVSRIAKTTRKSFSKGFSVQDQTSESNKYADLMQINVSNKLKFGGYSVATVYDANGNIANNNQAGAAISIAPAYIHLYAWARIE